MSRGFDGADAWLAYQTLVFFLDPPLLHWPGATPGRVWTRVAARVDPAKGPNFPYARPRQGLLLGNDVYANGLALLLDGLEARLEA
jgi:hypothetical protein